MEKTSTTYASEEEIVLPDGMRFPERLLATEEWLRLLYYTEHRGVNPERVPSMEQRSGRETLSYVLRTLTLLSECAASYGLTPEEYKTVETVLRWSEVSKGGTVRDREEWRRCGYPLDVHNRASAEIYLREVLSGTEENADQTESRAQAVADLIRTHGLIGQALRGEVRVASNAPLLTLKDVFGEASLRRIVLCLNHCIIGGVSRSLWEKVGSRALALCERILKGDLTEFPDEERLRMLDERLAEADEELRDMFVNRVFPKYEVWYYQAAFAEVSLPMVKWFLSKTLGILSDGVEVISFKPIADSLYYDYEGRKHLNVYKERILEAYMRDASVGYVEVCAERVGSAVMASFRFLPVCEKLIDFCVEAERSGLLSFEKSITVLYDMFGFRRDGFDRLNNESKYLETMNDTEASTKNSIIDYTVGSRVVDVGSGGGVLLDLLESHFPEKEIIGTDISENVIEVLLSKKKSEGHRWTVLRHNYVDGVFPEPVDCILFSSILHEVFSYTETDAGRFQIESVKKALRNAYDSLRPGGRIIIRDGVRTGGNNTLSVTFKDPEGLSFFRNFVQDFKGLSDIEDKRIQIDEDTQTVSGVTDYMREFLYTYTWGRQSYAHEVQEQFGYFTIEEFREFFESIGAKLIRCEAFLEPGYPLHLSPKVSLTPDRYPDSNCIVVAEKPE